MLQQLQCWIHRRKIVRNPQTTERVYVGFGKGGLVDMIL